MADIVPAVPPMTEKDIKKLEEVTKNRFKLLALQLKNRKKDMQAEAEQALNELYTAEIEKATSAMNELAVEVEQMAKKVDELNRKGLDLQRELEDQGIGVIQRDYNGRVNGVVTFYNPLANMSVKLETSDWRPRQLKEKLKKAYEEIDKLIRDAEEQLEMKRLEILEKLAIGVLQSDEAKKYVEQIPDIMDLIPQNAMPQLTK